MPRSNTTNYSIGNSSGSCLNEKYTNSRFGSSRGSYDDSRSNNQSNNRSGSRSQDNYVNHANYPGQPNNRFESSREPKSEFANTFKLVGGGGSKMNGMRTFSDNSRVLEKLNRYSGDEPISVRDSRHPRNTTQNNTQNISRNVMQNDNERFNNNTVYKNTTNKQYNQAHTSNNHTDRFSSNPKIKNVLSMDKVVSTSMNNRYDRNQHERIVPTAVNKRFNTVNRNNSTATKRYKPGNNDENMVEKRRENRRVIRRNPNKNIKQIPDRKNNNTFPRIMRDGGANAASRYSVAKNAWYRLCVDLMDNGTEDNYRNGIMKIYGDLERPQIFPTIKLPNIIFTNKSSVTSIEELNKFTSFDIYFKTAETAYVNIQMTNINLKSIKIEHCSEEDVRKSVSLWKLRKLYDLDFINYYLDNLFTDFDNRSFTDKFYGDYKLFANIEYFDTFIAKLKSKLRLKPNSRHINNDDQKTTVLYLTHSSIEYEQNPETLRTHKLAEVINNDNYNTVVGLKYGYPYDKPQTYYSTGIENKIIGDVKYVKLLNNNDNYNTNPLVDYLEKYITETIKMAFSVNAKVIHATTNFWNGIAAIYAAKFLGIKSVYEVRNFWDEIRPEIHNSDVVNLRDNLENMVMQKADRIIAINSSMKLQIIDRGIKSEKIYVIPDGVDIDNQELSDDERNKLTQSLNLDDYCGILGYLGSTYKGEGLKTLVDAIRVLQEEHDKRFKLIITGYGENDMGVYIRKVGLERDIVVIKTDGSQSIRYCDIIDTFVFPRNDEVEIDENLDNLFRVMSMEKPIIISDMYDTNGIMKDEDRCLIFERNNVNELVEKILRLHEDEELSNEMGSKCKQFVENFVDWKVFGNKIRNIYDDLLVAEEG